MKIEKAMQIYDKSENECATSENDYKNAKKRNIFLKMGKIIFE